MLTQLSTVKARLALIVTDYDGILTNAIKALSTRFDKETNPTMSRSTGITDEFSADDTEIAVSFTVAIRLPGKTFQSRIRLAKILQRRFSNNVDSQVHPAHQATYYTPEDPWTFCPDIGVPNTRAKLPEKPSNIKIAGQNDLLING